MGNTFFLDSSVDTPQNVPVKVEGLVGFVGLASVDARTITCRCFLKKEDNYFMRFEIAKSEFWGKQKKLSREKGSLTFGTSKICNFRQSFFEDYKNPRIVFGGIRFYPFHTLPRFGHPKAQFPPQHRSCCCPLLCECILNIRVLCNLIYISEKSSYWYILMRRYLAEMGVGFLFDFFFAAAS